MKKSSANYLHFHCSKNTFQSKANENNTYSDISKQRSTILKEVLNELFRGNSLYYNYRLPGI